VKCDAPFMWLTLIYLRNFYVGKTGCYSVIPSSIHPRELNLDWLTKLNLKEASSELALLQKEYSSGEREQAAEERAFGAETNVVRIQDYHWSSAGGSKD